MMTIATTAKTNARANADDEPLIARGERIRLSDSANAKAIAMVLLAFALVASVLGMVSSHASKGERTRSLGTSIGGMDLLLGARMFPRATSVTTLGAEDAEMKGNWDLYHYSGSKELVRLKEYDFRSGTNAEYERAVAWLRANAPEVAETCEAIRYEDDGKTLRALRANAMGDIGKTISHVIAWVNAKRSGAQSLIVASEKSFINAHAGPPNEFDSVVLSILLRGPEDWDVIFLDRGERGVAVDDAKAPETLFSNRAWVNDYVLFRNRATYAGEDLPVGLYMVSKNFLDKLPSHMRESPLFKLDNWLNDLCATKLACYSYTAQNWYEGATARRKEHLAKPTETAPIVDQSTQRVKPSVVVVDGAESKTSTAQSPEATAIETRVETMM